MRGMLSMISYEPLWVTMKSKGITTYTLIVKYGLSRQTIHKLKHNESTTLNTIQNLCSILECNIEDVVKITPDKM